MEIPISVFLEAITQETCKFLKISLSEIGGETWWENYVVSSMTPAQKRSIQNKKVESLDELDLSALLRVMSRHWDTIAYKKELIIPDDSKTIIHTVRDIRNKDAHKSIGKISPAEKYRTLDAIFRYLDMIGADQDVIEKIQREIQNTIDLMSQGTEIQDDKNAKKDEEKTEEPKVTLSNQQGISLNYVVLEGQEGQEVEELLKKNTYIGIDFGTSTTVVSYATKDHESNILTSIPIPIQQYDDHTICTTDELFPSCIAWTGKDILVGQGAERLKSEYESGINIWFSFKMKLGLNIGPQYYNSALQDPEGPAIITTPQEASTVFFKYLREQIEEYVKNNNLPSKIHYSVSVPAAFEANQRSDLLKSLGEAGISIPEYGLIDEPNAAYISYLVDTMKTGMGIVQNIKEASKNILVFDFGAGTCDISILNVQIVNEKFVSKNRAISQFQALGGDNIDRQLVRKYLLDQLIKENNIEEDFSSSALEKTVIPKLQKIAEDLKIQCCKYVSGNIEGVNISQFSNTERVITGVPVKDIKVRQNTYKLTEPNITFKQFAEVLSPFLESDLSTYRTARAEEDIVSIFEPITSALLKAELSKEDLDMILFIGGSSLNPFVQNAVQEYFGPFVETLELGDLRTPVSRGAAINSLMSNGLDTQFIKPITSEPIGIITRGLSFKTILPASTEIPSEEQIITDLYIPNDGQTLVQIPICVSNEEKILNTIEIPAPPTRPFQAGDEVSIMCSMDSNKQLKITAKIGTESIKTTLLNPLANKSLTPSETKMFEARQELSISTMKGEGLPPVESVLVYAYACAEADYHLQAAEMYELVQRLDSDSDFATSICYHYSMAGKEHLSEKWARIDYERHPKAVSAYNLALTEYSDGNTIEYERLMKESIEIEENYWPALHHFGKYLQRVGKPEGLQLISKAFKIMNSQFEASRLRDSDISRFRSSAEIMGKQTLVSKIDQYEESRASSASDVKQEFLLGSTDESRKERG